MTSKSYEVVCASLQTSPQQWLVTGVAGFIGSNLLERLLQLGQTVVGLDNFATGHKRNLEDVRKRVGETAWSCFEFLEGDIRDLKTCREAVADVNFVLHQSALGSVPRSLADPLTTHGANVDGFINMLQASREANVKRFVFAASSSTYGDDPSLPKIEHRIGRPLSPYAVTKLVNEIYADIYGRCFGLNTIGLRYFNVFGPRQDPAGPYAAVIPKWAMAMLRDEDVVINGDGETSRDFCFVANAVQANILAAVAPEELGGQVYNVAVGGRTSLNQLFEKIKSALAEYQIYYRKDPVYRDFRAGDVRHTQADIGKAARELGYNPTHSIDDGLRLAMPWYRALGS